jgi:hypothetical protein
MITFLLTAIAFAGQTPPKIPVPDEIVLESGRKLSGRVLCETKDDLIIRSGRGEVEVERKSVKEVRSLEHSLAEFIRGWDSIPRTDPRALADLAQFCDTRGLPGEARNLRLRVYMLDPSSEEAAKALGATKVGGFWEISDDKRSKRLDDYLAQKPRWRDAIELRTAHFLVRSDLPVQRLLDAMVQLERHYLRFYEVLGPELRLYVFAEVPEVNVYADARNYPVPPQIGEESWFQLGPNQLHVLARDPLDLRMIHRDVTEMLLYNALRQSSGHNGELQPWAQRGLAEYFAASAGLHVGDPWAPLGTPSHLLFDAQAKDPKPLSLHRLLITGGSEFRSGPDGERRSMYAYTFMHYLLNGDSGTRREPFFAYVRDAWLGAGGTKRLFTTLGMSEKDLEKRWIEHVQDVANRR